MTILWNKISHFSKDEFPEDPDLYAYPPLIRLLDKQRDLYGYRIYPSPASGALAREGNGHSMHCYETWGGSKAIDVFPDFCDDGKHDKTIDFLMLALASQLWGGIGVYLDTQFHGRSWRMFHLDLRQLGTGHNQENCLVWVRAEDGQYKYPQYDPRYDWRWMLWALA